MACVAPVIDSDQHLYETRTTWLDHIDPGRRDDALRIVDDELGYPWLSWGATASSDRSTCSTPGSRASSATGASASAPACRPSRATTTTSRATTGTRRRAPIGSTEMGIDEAVVFPNFGLLWERTLDEDLGALTANMTAWNRWCASVVDRRARAACIPVAHLTMRDDAWLARELADLERAGVHLAMIAPALVDGRPLSHPDHDRMWRAFVEHGVTPVFHVADQRRVFDDVWYSVPDDGGLPPLESVFLWTRGRARVHRPHPQRHARAAARAAHRHRRARRRSGCRCS